MWGDSIWLKGHEVWKADTKGPCGGLETRNRAMVPSRVGTRLPQAVAVGGEEDACSGHVKETLDASIRRSLRSQETQHPQPSALKAHAHRPISKP